MSICNIFPLFMFYHSFMRVFPIAGVKESDLVMCIETMPLALPNLSTLGCLSTADSSSYIAFMKSLTQRSHFSIGWHSPVNISVIFLLLLFYY